MQLLTRPVERLRDSFFVERLEQVVDCIHFKGLHRILIKSGGKDDLRQVDLAVHQLLDHAKAIKSRHLNVKKRYIR